MAERRGFLSIFTRHRTLANLILMVMVVGGLYSAPRIRAQFFPDTVVQEIDVRVQWDGAGPEDVDRSVVAVLEPSLMGVEGVANVTSRAVQGSAELQALMQIVLHIGNALNAGTARANAPGFHLDASLAQLTSQTGVAQHEICCS